MDFVENALEGKGDGFHHEGWNRVAKSGPLFGVFTDQLEVVGEGTNSFQFGYGEFTALMGMGDGVQT